MRNGMGKLIALGLVVSVSVAACASGASSGASASPPSVRHSGTRSHKVSKAAGAGSTVQTLTAGGASFAYVLHVPSGLGSAKVPLVISLHGSGGSGESQEQLTGMDAVADNGKFIVAYPDDYTLADLKALIKALEASDNVDPAKVYITGISEGGVYTEGLGCELAGEIAGIAAVAGPLTAKLASGCDPARPLPVLLISGTADPIIPYAGGEVTSPAGSSLAHAGTKVLSAPATMVFWRKVDGCTGSTSSTGLASTSGGTTTTVISGGACRDGTSVVLYRVNGGGHTWPGGVGKERTAAAEEIVGKTSTNFSASQVIWNFFRSS